MTPRDLDHAVISRRLRKIDDLVMQLEQMGPMSVEELESHPVEALAIERVLTTRSVQFSHTCPRPA